MKVSGSGYAAFSTVTVLIYSEPQVLTTVVTDAAGSFDVEVTVPQGLAAGQHTLVASGVDPTGVMRNLTLTVTVSGGGAATLAYTGADVVLPTIGGLLAVLAGAGLLLVARGGRPNGAPPASRMSSPAPVRRRAHLASGRNGRGNRCWIRARAHTRLRWTTTGTTRLRSRASGTTSRPVSAGAPSCGRSASCWSPAASSSCCSSSTSCSSPTCSTGSGSRTSTSRCTPSGRSSRRRRRRPAPRCRATPSPSCTSRAWAGTT